MSVENVILVVDDSPETLGMLNDALEDAGMTTLVALDGKQAIKIATKMKPDIILLDAIMPNMDGFETCAALKQDPQLAMVPVIFMTGLSDTENIVKGFEVGGVDYVTKPIKPLELIARMHTHLSNARMAKQAHNALDSTGQNVFSVNMQGDMVWSTPLVKNKLASYTQESYDDITQQLKNWIAHKPTNGNSLKLQHIQPSLNVTYIGCDDNDDLLLRLSEAENVDSASSLKTCFGVTNRESQVLDWIAKGKTNREIALILEMSPRTVNKHLEQIFKKLEVDNRTCAARKAIESLQAPPHF